MLFRKIPVRVYLHKLSLIVFVINNKTPNMCIIFNQSCGLEKEPSVEYFRKKASIIKT